MSKVVGLIGGMSWQTTAVYYREINQRVASRLGGLHSANVLIRSLDYNTLAGLVTRKDFDGMTELFCKYGLELKAAGAEALALCANVAHKAAEPLERRTGLPVLHIVDFTGQRIVESRMKRVGLLGTRAVMEGDFYKARLKEQHGLEVFIPADEKFRAAADRQIFNEMSKNIIPGEIKATWSSASDRLIRDHNVECIVLACTELRLLFGDSDLHVPIFETTTLHARGIADWALALFESVTNVSEARTLRTQHRTKNMLDAVTADLHTTWARFDCDRAKTISHRHPTLYMSTCNGRCEQS